MMNNKGKRKNNESKNSNNKRSGESNTHDNDVEDNIDGLEFEDPYGDEFEEEQYEQKEYNSEDEDETNDEMKVDQSQTNNDNKKNVWRPDVDELGEDEELEYDPSAYIMYHSIQTEWPCLSFDFIKDEFGDNRQRFPLTMLLVNGSQADRRERNKITLLKLSDVHKTKITNDDDSDNSDDEDDDDDDDDLDDDPTIEHVTVPHTGGVNRIRAMPQQPGIIATMSETKHAHIFDMCATVRSMMSNNAPRLTPASKPIYTFKGHQDEGFALDWSPVVAGRLATGDCKGNIHIWNIGNTSNSWTVDTNPYKGHTDSVEDLQWSPTEATVFISSSVDRTVRVWDIRGKTGPQITFTAHDSDVNVISWNRNVNYLLASGADDGSFKVWDLRSVKNKPDPLAHFTYHKQAITSIEWAPYDESVLCLSSEDNQVTIWDMSVEADDVALSSTGRNSKAPNTTSMSSSNEAKIGELPPQLLFIHQGQKDVKEVHYHPQIPGVIMSTAEESMDLYKPAINVAY